DTRLALKIDIDTHDGLARGVPAIASCLAARGLCASFFVVCGPDRMGRRLARLLSPDFVRKLIRTRPVRVYGWRTLLSGTLRPAAEGRVFRIPEIPTTLPTLDELYGRVARRPQALAECILQGLRPGQLNVHTLHAELEGGPHLDVLEALLDGVQGVARVVRLCDEATALAPATLPVCSVREGAVPGRAMPVALQGPSV